MQAYPGPTPPFDHLQGFWSNFYEGPRNGEPFPDVAPVRHSTRFLGFELNFPFGVPSCAVTPQSDYIKFFAVRGFDLLTYKTVRDRAWNPFFFPQWGFAPHVTSPLQPGALADPILATLDLGVVTDLSTTSLVNSFGVPSLEPPMWKADIAESRASLERGQVLVVSVVGSPEAEDTKSEADLIRQFVTAAADAQEAGADVIEVNLSCPNTPGRDCTFRSSSRGPVCASPDLSHNILSAIKKHVKSNTPVFAKIAYMNDVGLTNFVAKCQAVVDGIVGINAYPVNTRDPSGGAFFPGRVDDIAGLSGVGIRELGLKVTRQLYKLRQSHGATSDDWVIIGVGGVMTPTDYTAYRESGADAVQSCSGAWLDHFGRKDTSARSWRGLYSYGPAPRLSTRICARPGRGNRDRRR